MSRWPDLVPGRTVHARRGAVAHAFGYRVDYVLLDPESDAGPRLLSRNRPGLVTLHDRDHGGVRGAGRGAPWAREALAAHGLPAVAYDELLLLAQPGFAGALFNPVSFWLAMRDGALLAFIAEVNNTFGDRHCYLCAHPGFAPIRPEDRMEAQKVFHVSPFREIEGRYSFRMQVTEERVAIQILHSGAGDETLHATLTGPRRRLTNRRLLGAVARRPLGGVRTLALIYWQALRLRLKGARYRERPVPPTEEIT